jgi:hypothetical protein
MKAHQVSEAVPTRHNAYRLFSSLQQYIQLSGNWMIPSAAVLLLMLWSAIMAPS